VDLIHLVQEGGQWAQ